MKKRKIEDLDIRKSGQIYFNGKLVPQIKHNKGYLKIWASDTNNFVHRLVAQKYIPNPLNKPCVNHINGIKDDNRVENLEWVTYKENMKHALENNLANPTKYDDKFVNLIKSLRGKMPYKNIAEKYNIQYHTVKYIMYK